tara:strand:+ start:5112 stop:6050 length:939 start_codon:yes stop_codon:yes gene_type:complete
MVKIPSSNTGPMGSSKVTSSTPIVNDKPERKKGTEGLNNSYIMEAVPSFNKAEQEKVVSTDTNAFIIMGRDRPGSLDTGYGGAGNTHCGAIDIVAGLSGMLAREIDPETGGPVYTNKNTSLDAARVYISQRTDIDKSFNLTDGYVGSPKARSGIAIKADGVRLIAREGIKLITGTDTYNSQGVESTVVSGIDLIAGNDDKDLQPLVKGGNLSRCIEDLIDQVEDINGQIQEMIKVQSQLFLALSTHTHVATGPAAPVTPSPDLATFCVKKAPELVKILSNCVVSTKNSALLKVNYTKPIGEGYINSLFNTTN